MRWSLNHSKTTRRFLRRYKTDIVQRLIFIFLLIVNDFIYGQWFELSHEGVQRPYYVEYPSNGSSDVPLIINMHGFTNSVSYQIEQSQMNAFVNSKNVAVVYPQGINSLGIYSWNVGVAWDFNESDDITFISNIIDQVSQDFVIDSTKIYACGYSNGGFMTYELACELSNRIAAFGSVAGNFSLNIDQNCIDERDIPIIHVHGIVDAVVSYYGPSIDGSLTTPETIEYWKNKNDLDIESLEIINSNVEKIFYTKENSETKVVHYKVLNGDHEWVDDDWGFNTSEVLIDFFLQYSLNDFYEIIGNIIIGDIDNNGSVTLSDAFTLISLINSGSEYQEVADINFDGDVNIYDLCIVIDHLGS